MSNTAWIVVAALAFMVLQRQGPAAQQPQQQPAPRAPTPTQPTHEQAVDWNAIASTATTIWDTVTDWWNGSVFDSSQDGHD